MNVLNVGLIGLGRVGERHAKALKEIPEARLYALVGSTVEKANHFIKQQALDHSIHTYHSYEQMIADPLLHAVIIATPDKLHAQQVLIAMNANKHVFVEKPLCTTLAEGKTIADLFYKKKLTLGVGYHLRWHEGLREVTSRIHQKQIGDIHHMRLSWSVNFIQHAAWRIKPDCSQWLCLSVLGTHLLDIVRWVLVPICGEIETIHAYVDNSFLNGPYDESVSVHAKFHSGAIAEIFCSVLFDSPFQFEINGYKGHAVGMDVIGDEKDSCIFINHEKLNFKKSNFYYSELKNFIESIKYHKTPEVSLNEALKNVNNLTSIWLPKFSLETVS